MKSEYVLGTLTTVCLALASFSLKWTFDANAEIKLMQQKIEQLADNRDKDNDQDRQLKLLWKYTSWLDAENSKLRFKLNEPPSERPNWD